MRYLNVDLKHQETVAESRYYQDGEKWEALARRVAIALCSKSDGDKAVLEDTFNLINSKLFLPGGRILRNAGQYNRNMLNCFVLPIGDNIEAIGTCIKDSLITWAAGGGVGINFSSLRPKGTQIQGKGGYSSGLVSFITALDAVATTIESGGQRRAAAIAIVDISHPEVEEFIDAKLKHDKLKNFNISVAITNEFIEAVERDDFWKLTYGAREYKQIRAKVLWHKILKNIITSAEPGIINMSNLLKANSFYYAPVIATNPCGELPLQAYGSCDLGSLVLPKFVNPKDGSTKWLNLAKAIPLAVRLLDNVIDLTTFPIHEMKVVAEDSRRIGLGVMGLADYLFMKKLRYGSVKANEEIERLFKFIRDEAYNASVELAIEKGVFPKFDTVEFSKARFIRKLPAKLRIRIKKFGIRNVALLTCPPTGTISLVAGVTSGIEPLFSKAYCRKDKIGERIYIHPLYKEILCKKEKIPDWFVDSYDLTPEEHFEVQASIQKYIDGAISKTVNLPAGTSVIQLASWLQEYLYELKGVTVYVDKSRAEQVLYPLNKKEVLDYLEKLKS